MEPTRMTGALEVPRSHLIGVDRPHLFRAGAWYQFAPKADPNYAAAVDWCRRKNALICTGCGHDMIDAGVIGVECVNRQCPGNIAILESVRRAFADRHGGRCTCGKCRADRGEDDAG